MLKRTTLHFATSPDIQNVFLVCPNYEERSVGFLDHLDEVDSLNLNVFVTKLKGANPQELLDEIKDANNAATISYLKDKNIHFQYQKFLYPISDVASYITEILRYIKSVTNTCNLFIDISSMPRNLIFRFLDYLFAHIKSDIIQIDELTIKSLHICYTPAAEYPSIGNIDEIGGIIGIYKNKPFHRLIREYDKVNLQMFTSGNCHDVSQVYSQSYEDGVNSQIVRQLFVFLNRDNFLHSYRKIGENNMVINMAMRNNDQISYFYDIEHVCEMLYCEMEEIVRENQDFNSALLAVGAFGTKMICLSSYLAKKRFDVLHRNQTNFQSDVLTNDIGQYVSLYSIGKGITEFYSVDLLKLDSKQ